MPHLHNSNGTARHSEKRDDALLGWAASLGEEALFTVLCAAVFLLICLVGLPLFLFRNLIGG